MVRHLGFKFPVKWLSIKYPEPWYDICTSIITRIHSKKGSKLLLTWKVEEETMNQGPWWHTAAEKQSTHTVIKYSILAQISMSNFYLSDTMGTLPWREDSLSSDGHGDGSWGGFPALFSFIFESDFTVIERARWRVWQRFSLARARLVTSKEQS